MRFGYSLNRIKFVRMAAVFLFLVVFARLSYLQAIAADDLSRRAVVNRTMDSRPDPERGEIFDATGKVLATSVPTKTVYIEPNVYQDAVKKLKAPPSDKLKQLADYLKMQLPDLQAKANSNSKWLPLARQVDLNTAAKINKLEIPGIGFVNDSKRVYPMGNLAASVLGIVNMAGHGAEGLELGYDQDLFGVKGFLSEETDARDSGILGGVHTYEPPQDGDNLTLTVDSNIQYIVERQLDDLMVKSQPKRAVIIVMDPKSGKILAMANRPSFDPNDYPKYQEPERRDMAITSQYEPGSTFKVVTLAAALEEGITKPDKQYKDPGYLILDNQRITNWDTGSRSPGMISLTKGFEQSSNVVFGQVGLELGRDTFFKYLRGFGFGQPTGVDLPGEAGGTLLKEQTTSKFELATMAFGQANAVTPLQLLTAVCAVANGGTLYRPYVVDKVADAQGNVLQQNKPVAVRQVVSKYTADTVTRMMEDVVYHGTGGLAQINGYQVAGKTGTAQKVGPDGKYSETDYIGSFIGFAPADNPRLAVMVVVDSAQKGSPLGGNVAAPRFKAIVEQSLQYLNVPPTGTGEAPPLQIQPASGKPQSKPAAPERAPAAGEGVVPDLTGLTMSEAGELLSKQGLRMNFVGTGLATGQNYPPGKVLAKGTVITVTFSP